MAEAQEVWASESCIHTNNLVVETDKRRHK